MALVHSKSLANAHKQVRKSSFTFNTKTLKDFLVSLNEVPLWADGHL